MAKLKYANMEIDFTVERLVEIAQSVIDGLMIDGEDTALEYIADTTGLTEYEANFFGINYEEMQTYSRYYDGEPYDFERDDYGNEEPWGYEERNYQRLSDDGYNDDSDRWCKDCPPDECTGHCMSCYYRPV